MAKAEMMSACGVMCSECPAFHGKEQGLAHQKRTAAAWKRIYGMKVTAADIDCGGCSGEDDRLFRSSVQCKARQCCRAGGFASCAECSVDSCARLEEAQAVWDEVPRLIKILSKKDFAIYAQPYCGHRERLGQVRREFER
jgi:hypothetical protein